MHSYIVVHSSTDSKEWSDALILRLLSYYCVFDGTGYDYAVLRTSALAR